MSLQMMSTVWDTPAPLVQKMVLLRIADQCGDDGLFKIDQQAAAKACGIDEISFTQCLARLESDGLLRLTARTYGPSGNVIAHGALDLKSAAPFRAKND